MHLNIKPQEASCGCACAVQVAESNAQMLERKKAEAAERAADDARIVAYLKEKAGREQVIPVACGAVPLRQRGCAVVTLELTSRPLCQNRLRWRTRHARRRSASSRRRGCARSSRRPLTANPPSTSCAQSGADPLQSLSTQHLH